MKVILLTSFLIEFTVHQPATNSVAGSTNFAYKLSGHHEPFRKRLNSPKPNYGYEAYWNDSEWVFPKHERTTAGDDKITCATVFCPLIYIKYGEICGQNVKQTHKTFQNYCELQNEDCTETERWMMAYRGKCIDEIKIYPFEKHYHTSRAMEYLGKLTRTTGTGEGR